MMRRGALFAGLIAAWASLLGMEWWLEMPVEAGWFSGFQQTAKFEIQNRENQWIVYSFFTLYALAFIWLPLCRDRRRGSRSPGSTPVSPAIQTAFLVILALLYWRDYDSAVHSGSALALLTGLLAGRAVAFVRGGRNSEALDHAILGALCVFLAGIALWQPDHGMEFHYRDSERWAGIWDNPNRYGLLTGVASLIAATRGVQALVTTTGKKRTSPWPRFAACGWLTATAATGLALIKSFSRGAWLGTALGAAWLLLAAWRRTRAARAEPELEQERSVLHRWTPSARSLTSQIHRNVWPLILIGLACAAILFWTCRDSEARVLRRIFSVANVNDFSWRNRVAAYEGALKMMADRPLAGVGWDQTREHYGAFYADPRIEEWAAISLNDYFSIGTSLGLPVLALFTALIGLSIRRWSSRETAREGRSSSVDLAVSRAATIVLLTGFWFDDGLLYLALGVPFWVLLELSNPPSARAPKSALKEDSAPDGPTGGARARPNLGERLSRTGTATPLILTIGFACALAAAKAEDPFHRIAFRLTGPDDMKTPSVAILPKPVSERPVIIYLHGSRGTTIKDGRTLQTFAELGFAAVSLDYDQTNSAAFDSEFTRLLTWIDKQPWARKGAVAWVANSLGAQRSLSYLLNEPSAQPQLYVRTGGGLVEELSDAAHGATNAGQQLPFNAPTLLLHGENDRIFPAADCEKLEKLLRAHHIPSATVVLPGQQHSFRPDREAVMRALAEYCAEYLHAIAPAREWRTSWQRLAWAPLFFLLAGISVIRWRIGRRQPSPGTSTRNRAERRLLLVATIATLGALGLTAAHLAVPRMAFSAENLRRAVRWGVADMQEADIEFLSGLKLRSSTKLGEALEHLELTDYRGPFLYQDLEPEIWRHFVISPAIAGTEGQPIDWRRPLWESFYPRVRKETDPTSAAKIVVRHLRERVGFNPERAPSPSPRKTWSAGMANVPDWERLYIAALRSATVAARLGDSGKAEIWSGEKWAPAPRPIIGRLEAELK